MRISSNVVLRGDAWAEAMDKLRAIIDTQYGVYVISVALGIFADKQIDALEAMHYPDAKFEINSAMLYQNRQTLDLLFRSAILTTETVSCSEEIRMELAFNDDARSEEAKRFKPVTFLTKFANYGATQLAKRITEDPLETIEALNEYMVECADGFSFDEIDLEELDISEEAIGGLE